MAVSRFVATSGDAEIEPCRLFGLLIATVPDLAGAASRLRGCSGASCRR